MDQDFPKSDNGLPCSRNDRQFRGSEHAISRANSPVLIESMTLPPHPPLAPYRNAPVERQQFVNELFDSAAPYYDRIVSAMSFGTGNWYRREALRRHGLVPGMKVLDVATGTGMVARAASDLLGGDGMVVGLDPSRGMLNESQRAGAASLVQSVGETLPFASDTFDFLTMGFALRHVSDLEAAFRGYRRVLRPGGRVLLLEISRPESASGRAAAGLFFGRFVPLATRIGTGSDDAQRMMKYYWDTIDQCVPAEAILGALRRAGFSDVERVAFLGVFSEYTGRA